MNEFSRLTNHATRFLIINAVFILIAYPRYRILSPRDVEDCKLSLNNDAEDESAKVGESRGEKERGEADEGGDGAGLPHNLPANLLAKGPTSAVR